MRISPLPRRGSTVVGRDQEGRRLRIAAHPASGRVVLSIWQDDVCRATIRLAAEDVPGVVEQLTRSLLPVPAEESDAG